MKVEFMIENEIVTATVLKEYLINGSTVFLCYNEVIVDDPQGLRSLDNPLRKRQSYLIEASKILDFIILSSDIITDSELRIKNNQLTMYVGLIIDKVTKNPNIVNDDIKTILTGLKKIVEP